MAEKMTAELKAKVDVIQRSASPHEEKVTEIEALLGYPICAAHNREALPCINISGKGTSKKGEMGMRCYNHGGRNQTEIAGNFKHGRYAKVKTNYPELQQKLQDLAEDYDVFDLREELVKLRLLADILLEQGEIHAGERFLVDAIKAAKDLNDLEFQRRLVISAENIQLMVMRVIEIIQRHVKEPMVRAKIAQELAQIRVSSKLPASQQLEAHSLAEEVLSGA